AENRRHGTWGGGRAKRANVKLRNALPLCEMRQAAWLPGSAAPPTYDGSADLRSVRRLVRWAGGPDRRPVGYAAGQTRRLVRGATICPGGGRTTRPAPRPR